MRLLMLLLLLLPPPPPPTPLFPTPGDAPLLRAGFARPASFGFALESEKAGILGSRQGFRAMAVWVGQLTSWIQAIPQV